MGYVVKNGINYFGDNSVSLTQAQYDALPSSKLTDGVNYFITDAPGDVGNIIHATEVTYDNSNSRLSSGNVQGAIDEICTNFIKVKTISLLCTQLTQGFNLTSYVSIDAGYKFLCWLPTGASDGWVADFPIYIANVSLSEGNVYWSGTMRSGTNAVRFSYLEIRGA